MAHCSGYTTGATVYGPAHREKPYEAADVHELFLAGSQAVSWVD